MKIKRQKRIISAKARAAVQAASQISTTDTLGMYTGNPAKGDNPTQDADDL